MKFPQLLLAMTTAITLLSIDGRAPGAPPEYGGPMRALVWCLILANVAVMVALARSAARAAE